MPHDQTRWLDEALRQIPEVLHEEIEPYLHDCLKRCHAKSRKTFWQWLRIQLSKNGYHNYLSYVSELNLPPETVKPHQREGFRYVLSKNGDVALIEIVDGENHVIWRVPVSKLDWALSMYPISLKRLPDLESPEVAESRRLQRQLKNRKPFLPPDQQEALVTQIENLKAMERRAFAPVPRFELIKYAGGKTFGVHRLFLDAEPGDIVGALDEDFTNFASLTVTVTTKSLAKEGIVIRKGKLPLVQTQDVTLPNLYIIHDDESQKNFEDKMLQIKMTPHGDIKTTLKVQPNADLGIRTGVEGGRVADCGPSSPVTDEEATVVGLTGGEVRPMEEVAKIQRRWSIPKLPSWRFKW